MDPDSTATALGITPEQTGQYHGTRDYIRDEVIRLQNDVIRLKQTQDTQRQILQQQADVIQLLSDAINNVLAGLVMLREEVRG